MKGKLVNKILAIALSAAMAVTALPQTNAWATETEEIQITEGDTIATDVPEQTEADVDSADAESEACQEGDIDVQTAVSENQLPVEIVPDESAVEDETNDNISAETVGDGSKENPYVIKEGEETELTFAVRSEDDYCESVYISFTPSKTGIYTYSFDGADVAYENNLYCSAGLEPLVFAGQNYIYCLENYGNKSNLNITIKFLLEKECLVGEKMTIDAEKNKNASIVMKGNTVYPVTFSKPGNYVITAMDSTKKQSVKLYNELLKKEYTDVGDTNEITDIAVTKEEIYYFYSEEDNVLNAAYSEYDVVQEGYNDNVPEIARGCYFSFTPSETAIYYLDAFFLSGTNQRLSLLEKGKEYILGSDYSPGNEVETYPIIWKLKQGTNELSLGENQVSDAKVSQYTYACDEDVDIYFAFPTDVKYRLIIQNDNQTEIIDESVDVASCKKGDILHILIYNKNMQTDNFYAKKLVFQSEASMININEENIISSGTSDKIYFYMLPNDLEFGVYDITISNITENTKFGLYREKEYYDLRKFFTITKNTFSRIDMNTYQYLAITEPDSTKVSYTVTIKKKELPQISVGSSTIDISNGSSYYEFSVEESGYYQIYGYNSTETDYYIISDIIDEDGDSCLIESTSSYDQPVYCYFEKEKKYVFCFEDVFKKDNRSITISDLDEIKCSETNSSTWIYFKDNQYEVINKFIAPETGYVILDYSDSSIVNTRVFSYDSQNGYEQHDLVKKGETYYISLYRNKLEGNYKYIKLKIDTVTYKNEQAAAAAVEMIKAIGTVTLEKKAAIDEARAAYDALTDSAKKCVSAADLKILTDAETTYAKLVAQKAAAEAEAAKKAAEETAAKAAAEEAAKKAAAEAAAAEAAKKEAVGAENVVGDATYVIAENQTVIFKAPSKKDATSVKIPETIQINGKDFAVTEIAADAFKNNKKLTKVTMPKNIKVIGKNAFQNCSALKTVTIGSSVTTIGDGAFQGCSRLTKVTIPAKVTKIGKNAFYNCKKLKTVTVKTSSIKTVGKSAFKNIAKNATIKVSKKKLAAYKKLLKKSGIGSKVKVTK